jgi:uncharacterized membrane protein
MQMLTTTGRVFYAIAIMAFGLLHVGYGDFVTRVVPWWPAWIPGRSIWAYIIGTLLIAAGAALLMDRRTVAVSTLLAWGLLLSFVLLGVPLAAGDTLLGGGWTMAGKALALSGGALLIAQASSAQATDRTPRSLWLDPRVTRLWSLAPWFFAAFLVLCGIQHFIYIDFVMSLVPAWIPGPRFWGYAAGVALIASGLGLLLPATTRLAGLLSGLMIFSWVFLVHIPRAARTFPATSNETTAVFEALAMTGIAWLAAALSERRQLAPEAERERSGRLALS